MQQLSLEMGWYSVGEPFIKVFILSLLAASFVINVPKAFYCLLEGKEFRFSLVAVLLLTAVFEHFYWAACFSVYFTLAITATGIVAAFVALGNLVCNHIARGLRRFRKN